MPYTQRLWLGMISTGASYTKQTSRGDRHVNPSFLKIIHATCLSKKQSGASMGRRVIQQNQSLCITWKAKVQMECVNPQRQEQESQVVGIPWDNALKSSVVIASPAWKCLVYYLVGECGNQKSSNLAEHKSKAKLQKIVKGKHRSLV